jgi:hypothetical protein
VSKYEIYPCMPKHMVTVSAVACTTVYETLALFLRLSTFRLVRTSQFNVGRAFKIEEGGSERPQGETWMDVETRPRLFSMVSKDGLFVLSKCQQWSMSSYLHLQINDSLDI